MTTVCASCGEALAGARERLTHRCVEALQPPHSIARLAQAAKAPAYRLRLERIASARAAGAITAEGAVLAIRHLAIAARLSAAARAERRAAERARAVRRYRAFWRGIRATHHTA